MIYTAIFQRYNIDIFLFSGIFVTVISVCLIYRYIPIYSYFLCPRSRFVWYIDIFLFTGTFCARDLSLSDI